MSFTVPQGSITAGIDITASGVLTGGSLSVSGSSILHGVTTGSLTATGTLSSYHGNISGTTVAAGYIGQTLTTGVINITTGASNSTFNITSLALTAGVWLMIARVSVNNNAATNIIGAEISNANAVFDTGDGNIAFASWSPNATFTTSNSVFKTVNISATTTYYLNVRVTGASTIPSSGMITACRTA
jgi:hypothetical protein